MISISRSMLLAAGLLAFPAGGVMAQQTDSNHSATGGSTLKHTVPGSTADVSGASNSGGSTLKSTKLGDMGKTVTPETKGNPSGTGRTQTSDTGSSSK